MARSVVPAVSWEPRKGGDLAGIHEHAALLIWLFWFGY
jgi:hypothetical protein